MSARDLGRRLHKLEYGTPADRSQQLDLSALTDAQLDEVEEIVSRATRLSDGTLDFSELSIEDLSVIAQLPLGTD